MHLVGLWGANKHKKKKIQPVALCLILFNIWENVKSNPLACFFTLSAMADGSEDEIAHKLCSHRDVGEYGHRPLLGVDTVGLLYLSRALPEYARPWAWSGVFILHKCTKLWAQAYWDPRHTKNMFLLKGARTKSKVNESVKVKRLLIEIKYRRDYWLNSGNVCP